MCDLLCCLSLEVLEAVWNILIFEGGLHLFPC